MKLVWDETGHRLYETGTKNGVLFPQNSDGTYAKGVAWNGLTAVTESPSGADSNDIYADDMKYLSLQSAETFGCTIEAYTYPDEWAECDGSAEPKKGVTIGQQARKGFGFSYRSAIGNDVVGDTFGYKLHLIYGGKASPSEKGYQTINDSPEAITFSWEVTTTPVNVEGYKPTASLTIDSTKAPAGFMDKIMEILYGTDTEESKLPLPSEVLALYDEFSVDTYSPVTPEEGDNPSEKGWYEESNGAYTLTSDTSVEYGKTYYTKDA